MTPRTRNSNRDADFKVYYSKKVPQQVYFPHKRKTVRRRTTPVRDGQERRQMVFLPDKMREQKAEVIEDSEDSGSLDTDTEESVEEETTKVLKQKGRKRNSDIMNEEPDSEHADSIANLSKRRRKTVPPKSHRRIRRIQITSDNEADEVNSTDRERTLRRQSTMTQLVDGRKPLPDVEEPDFKPVKKPSRLSWSGKGKKSRDEKQRTLTQMVPGMRPLEIMSDEDLDEAPGDAEAEDNHDQAYGNAVARRLAQQGLYQTGDNDGDSLIVVKTEKGLKSKAIKEEDSSMPDSQGITESIVQSVEDDCDNSYKPTQFIEAPSRRPDRANRRSKRETIPKSGETSDALSKSTRSSKSRFSLLSTPEKRRIREIPSSQSPADSPIVTQVTPPKSGRSPLKQCMANSNNAVVETPSKRKQVAFSMPSKTPVPPPKLRRFESTIQDSEDEEDDIIEEEAFLARRVEKDIDESVEVATPGKSIGADTQRMLDEIDRACDEANATGDKVEPGLSSKLGNSSITRGYKEPSPELGESHEQLSGQKVRALQKEQLASYEGPTGIKQEPKSEDEDDKSYPEWPSVQTKSLYSESPLREDATISIKAELPAHTDELHSSPPVLEADFQETSASTPMVLQDYSSDEERSLDRDPIAPRSSRRSLPQPTYVHIQQFKKLDDESIQVPRSPSPQQESQQSNSSKAEQQLQNEWLSYSQYVKARPAGSSSVRVAPDAFSYDATPRPPRNPDPALQYHSSGYRPSQATTVDEITQRTPRTKRTQHISSTHTTPHRIASSQPVFTTPNKLPPPLFIPSSFPSPEKTSAHAEGWSSPIMGMTQDVAGGHYKSSQWASLEDFSIPPPPPPPPGEGEDEEN